MVGQIRSVHRLEIFWCVFFQTCLQNQALWNNQVRSLLKISFIAFHAVRILHEKIWVFKKKTYLISSILQLVSNLQCSSQLVGSEQTTKRQQRSILDIKNTVLIIAFIQVFFADFFTEPSNNKILAIRLVSSYGVPNKGACWLVDWWSPRPLFSFTTPADIRNRHLRERFSYASKNTSTDHIEIQIGMEIGHRKICARKI